MRPIPPKLKQEILADEFYETCCVADENCAGFIRWHHALIFGGRQVNSKFCILPLCDWHHDREKEKELHTRLTRIVLNRASMVELRQLSKAIDYVSLRDRLNASQALDTEEARDGKATTFS